MDLEDVITTPHLFDDTAQRVLQLFKLLELTQPPSSHMQATGEHVRRAASPPANATQQQGSCGGSVAQQPSASTESSQPDTPQTRYAARKQIRGLACPHAVHAGPDAPARCPSCLHTPHARAACRSAMQHSRIAPCRRHTAPPQLPHTPAPAWRAQPPPCTALPRKLARLAAHGLLTGCSAAAHRLLSGCSRAAQGLLKGCSRSWQAGAPAQQLLQARQLLQPLCH